MRAHAPHTTAPATQASGEFSARISPDSIPFGSLTENNMMQAARFEPRNPRLAPPNGLLAGLSRPYRWLPSPVVSADLPPIVAEIDAEIDAAEIAARIAAWRASNRPFDALLRENVPPAQASRRLALTLWAAGDPRRTSLILATAAALAPTDAPIWLDLGGALQAIGDHAQAFAALERAVALDPAPARAWLALAVVANEHRDKRRAEASFAAALERDPTLHDAAFGLGLLAFEQRRYAEAAAHFRGAITGGCANALVHAGLGQSLFFLGDFSGAARALERHLARRPADPTILRRHALARFLETFIAGEADAAREAYLASAGAFAEPLEEVARAAFHILSAYGYGETALRLARDVLPRNDDDPVQRYHLAAVSGGTLARAPRDYVVAYFDQFAAVFDQQLVDVLQYRVPEKLLRMIAATGRPLPRALDLGCGTGLAGPRLRGGRSRLVGVDLAPRMLDKARDRGVYDKLVEAEMIDFLEGTPERFDLIFAADALIYLGELDGFLRAAAEILEPGGLLAFNIETTKKARWELLPSGRFAHDLDALLVAAAPWFTPKASRRAFLRMEAHQRVRGALAVLERTCPCPPIPAVAAPSASDHAERRPRRDRPAATRRRA